jgi:hypothetical protein
MTQELKTKWLTALRSGEYKQGIGVLRSAESDSYCCLGVLCDISELGTWHSLNYKFITKKGFMEEGYAFLPPTIAADINLSRIQQRKLSGMNDSDLYSFTEIADWIEKNV